MLSEILNFRKYLYPLTLLVLLVALALTGMEWSGGVRYFNDMLYMDNFNFLGSIFGKNRAKIGVTFTRGNENHLKCV